MDSLFNDLESLYEVSEKLSSSECEHKNNLDLTKYFRVNYEQFIELNDCAHIS